MHKYIIKPSLLKLLRKLEKKDKKTFEIVIKKIEDVVRSYSLEHYKNLRYNMNESKRVHIGHLVLVFRYDKNQDRLIFEDFDHHDNIYIKK